MSVRHLLLAALLASHLLPLCRAQPPSVDSGTWYGTSISGAPRLRLYFFWSKACPHCLEARPFVAALAADYPWLEVRSLELTEHPENARLYADMAARLGETARSVPAFLFCGTMLVGYRGEAESGNMLRTLLLECRARSQAGAVVPQLEAPLTLPVVGRIDPRAWSLPALTLVLAGLDAFNPCAFFVLLFLLSLLAHARSRRRMALIGGVFVLCSGLVYFAFMAAWLNLFLLAGELRAVTLAAGTVAVLAAILNIKDFFWLRQGPSLSIPEGAKPGLYRRIRALAQAGGLAAMLPGTVLLALAANSYELLCTAGFPMVFTRVLTLERLPDAAYYAYLALYNGIYVLPLAAIVLVFTATLGARKLTEAEGRGLKLMSGTMMLGLGLVLLFAPQALNNVLTALALLAAALGLTFLAMRLDRRRNG